MIYYVISEISYYDFQSVLSLNAQPDFTRLIVLMRLKTFDIVTELLSYVPAFEGLTGENILA